MVSVSTEPILIFWIFMKKNPCKKKKVPINCFGEQEKPWIFLKILQKKNKNFKAIWAVLEYSKPKIFFVGQLWWPTFFQTLLPATMLVLLQTCRFSSTKIFKLTTYHTGIYIAYSIFMGIFSTLFCAKHFYKYKTLSDVWNSSSANIYSITFSSRYFSSILQSRFIKNL